MLIALPQYARLQLLTTAHVDTLLEMGLSDLRPEVLPARFDESVGTWSDDEISPRLASIRPLFVAWCGRLSESPIGPGLDHNDLHPWNILGIGSGIPASASVTTAIFYDWGDSVVAHPFGSALGSISRVQRMLRLDPDHRDVRRMSDAYLKCSTIWRAATTCSKHWSKAARAVVWDRSEKSIGEYLSQAAHGDYGI